MNSEFQEALKIKNRKKKKSSKSRRLEYRKNLLNNIVIELDLG
jgi:hypothetical protein